jgi:hypothetical protein
MAYVTITNAKKVETESCGIKAQAHMVHRKNLCRLVICSKFALKLTLRGQIKKMK